MSEPIYLTCRSEEDIHPADEIIRQVTEDRDLALEFTATRRAKLYKLGIIERLTAQLPMSKESVEDNGSDGRSAGFGAADLRAQIRQNPGIIRPEGS